MLARILIWIHKYTERFISSVVVKEMSAEDMIISSRAIIENPMYQYTLERMEEEIIDRWKKGTTPELRELAWYEWKTLEGFDRRVEKVLENASLDAKFAEEAKKWKSTD